MLNATVPTPDPPLEFPPLLDIAPPAWPDLPFTWRHAPVPAADIPQPCRLDRSDGTSAELDLAGLDLQRGVLGVRGAATGGRRVELPLAQCRRLTLLAPLVPLGPTQGAATHTRRTSLLGAARPDEPAHPAAAALLPLAEHERSYLLPTRGPGEPLRGRTIGFVETHEGLFLFEPSADDGELLRVFVPRAANDAPVLGATALEQAQRGWAATPAQVLQATETLRRSAVPRLGDALLSLGLVTRRQLEQALAQSGDAAPVGETLVAGGLISASQLKAAIAHKMGCPVVDVARFRPDPAAVSLLPQRLALSHRVLPLFVDGGRLFVASDMALDPDKLRAIQVYVDLAVVPVLARTPDLMAALRAMPATTWSARRA